MKEFDVKPQKIIFHIEIVNLEEAKEIVKVLQKYRPQYEISDKDGKKKNERNKI